MLLHKVYLSFLIDKDLIVFQEFPKKDTRLQKFTKNRERPSERIENLLTKTMLSDHFLELL